MEGICYNLNMNLFAIEPNPHNDVCYYTSAKSHDDFRVSKMIIESCQMLSATANNFGIITRYKQSHFNHPTTKWVRESSANFNKLLYLAQSLKAEYSQRYGKHNHGCDDVINHMISLAEDDDFVNLFPSDQPTTLPLCMPNEYKINNNNVVDSYRNFFANKPKLRYYHSTPPSWIEDYRSKDLPPIQRK